MKVFYHIIATVDSMKSNLPDIMPDFLKMKREGKKVFQQTENSRSAEEPYSKHHKYIGIVSFEELQSILEDNYIEGTCKTGGAITFYGCSPAISWDIDITNSYHNDCVCNCYVSPIFESKGFDKLSLIPENEAKIKIGRLNNQIDSILDSLENLDIEDREIEIDIEQCELVF